MNPGLTAAKKAFRVNVSNILKQMATEDINKQSLYVFNKLINSPEWARSKRIAFYLATPTEVQTEALIVEAFKQGKTCFAPLCKGNDMRMLQIKDIEDLVNLPANSWGIRQPKPAAGRVNAMETGGLDLVIVPGVAFTNDRMRLGHGRGYYDRFLFELKDFPRSDDALNPVSIAIAFHQQIFDEIPFGDLDYVVDQLLYQPEY